MAIFGVAALSALFWLGHWIGKVNEHKKGVGKAIEEIRKDIKKILKRMPVPTVTGRSPLQLTDLGKSISEDLDAKEWAKDIVPSLQDQVKGMLPFELQDWCMNYVKNEFQPDASQTLRLNMAAYNNALDLDAVLDVLALEMRDLMLKLFEIPNTEPEQADTTAHT